MRLSAWQQIAMILAIHLASGCSKITVSKVSSQSGRLDSGSKSTEPKTDKDEARDQDAEKVVPPNNISGTFLACEINRDADPAATQATTLCALRDEKTQGKVDLAMFRSHEWTTSLPDLNSVTSTTRELPADSVWHLEVQIKATSSVQLELALEGTSVALSVRGANGKSDSASTSIMPTAEGPRWMSLNGDRLPRDAIEGGTEHINRDILTICRVYTQGGVYPGKMQPHYANANRSICYSSKDNEGIKSQSDDGRTLNFNNDVLVTGNRAWSEVLEWTSMMPAMPIPKNALIGGVDDKGETLFVCRGLEYGPPPADSNDTPNAATGEWTPGYVKASTGYCQHEYYGQKNSVTYQILVWKAP